MLKSIRYISSVDLGTTPATPAQEAEIEARQAAYAIASDKFFNQQSLAFTRWLSDPFAQAIKQPFSAWVSQNDALYISYKNAMKNAAANLAAYQRALYGPLADILNDDVTNIQENANNILQEVVGYISTPRILGERS